MFFMLPYGDVWRESRRIFTKYFSNSNINQPRDILFPGAKFQRKAAVMRIHVEKMRNATFAATKKLMVFTL